MSKKPTFDEAQEAFRANPQDDKTRCDFAVAASIYYADDMIGYDTFRAALDEIVASFQ